VGETFSTFRLKKKQAELLQQAVVSAKISEVCKAPSNFMHELSFKAFLVP
jgi:hypothetical protein